MTPKDISNRKLKILFFDYWTAGIHSFFRIADAIPSDEAEFLLFHLGSYRDSTIARFEVIRGIPCIDISAFQGLTLETILRSLSPDIVIGLNIGTLFDRTIYRTCKRIGIPTVFLQHGAWADLDTFKEVVQTLDTAYTWMDRIKRLPKFLRIIPWYLRENGREIATLKPWQVIWKNMKTPTLSQFYPVYPEDLWPTKAIVYNSVSAEKLIQTHRLPCERILVAGNPELDLTITRLKNPLSDNQRTDYIRSVGLDPSQPILCQIEDAFVEQQNMFGWTEERRVNYLSELYDACNRVGVQLLVRPHPVANTLAMMQVAKGKCGFAITKTLSLVDTLDVSDAVLGTISTALESAIVLGKPLITPLWYLDGQETLAPCLRYGVAAPVISPADLSAVILRAVQGNLENDRVNEFATRRLGVTDGSAVSRIVAVILALAQAKFPS